MYIYAAVFTFLSLKPRKYFPFMPASQQCQKINIARHREEVVKLDLLSDNVGSEKLTVQVASHGLVNIFSQNYCLDSCLTGLELSIQVTGKK